MGAGLDVDLDDGNEVSWKPVASLREAQENKSDPNHN